MNLEEAVKYLTDSEAACDADHLFALGTIMESPRPLRGIDPYIFLPYLDCGGTYASFAARCLYLLTGRDGITTQVDLENWCESREKWRRFLDDRAVTTIETKQG